MGRLLEHQGALWIGAQHVEPKRIPVTSPASHWARVLRPIWPGRCPDNRAGLDRRGGPGQYAGQIQNLVFMKRKLLSACAVALFWTTCPTLAIDDSAALQGNWSVKKTNDEGQHFTQSVELKKDKFIFRITGLDNQFAFHAEGDVKLEKLGPFNAIRFYHIRGGQSADNLRDIDAEYTVIYVLDQDTWTAAMNFDDDHGHQKPGVDVYKRVKKNANEAK